MSWGWPGSYLQRTPTNTEVLRVDLPALEKTVKDERKQFWKEKQDKAKERAKK